MLTTLEFSKEDRKLSHHKTLAFSSYSDSLCLLNFLKNKSTLLLNTKQYLIKYFISGPHYKVHCTHDHLRVDIVKQEDISDIYLQHLKEYPGKITENKMLHPKNISCNP